LAKLQVPLMILLLLGVVVGMNTVADLRQQRAKEHAKEVERTRHAAEAAAAAAKARTEPDASHSGKPAFKLPPNSGPVGAPVKVEIFINDTNSCHEASTSLTEIQKIYGPLVRLEWWAMSDPKVAQRSDRLDIGCEAGLTIDGKLELELEKNGGRVLVSFRGPVGDKYHPSDVYRAINEALRRKGKTPPAAAVAKAKV
jgi:hypothetical protein